MQTGQKINFLLQSAATLAKKVLGSVVTLFHNESKTNLLFVPISFNGPENGSPFGFG